ncbi:NAD(P)-binding domain-containing protein [Streptomyces sp. NPDC050804]|uniref:NADPH-dependent F420 reductase n=1 Tax=unclassified Streptomyces TaxID=2593676 RepID=UPI0034252494|nr:NAD(P)-binding domain-containing protein [Streptomyces sp. NBC_00872]
MSRIGLLGTGNVAKVLGAKLILLGHEVVLGSRDPENSPVAEWAAGHGAGLTGLAEAAAGADLVVNTAPGLASLDVLTKAGADNLRGKVIIDVSNGIESRNGVTAVATPDGGSIAEQLQSAFPEARVVKTLNTMAGQVMVDPGRIPGHHTVFLSGDDPAAKAEVTELLKSFGWSDTQILDIGGVVTARATEAALLLFIHLFSTFGSPEFNLSVAKA